MYEDITARHRRIGSALGDIVVASDEDVVIADSDASNDMMQDAFADDMITGGDEGLGFAQARRLKAKLGRNKRKLAVGRVPYRYAVAAATPYQFGAVTFNPVRAAAGAVTGGLVAGFKPKISLKAPMKFDPSGALRILASGSVSYIGPFFRLRGGKFDAQWRQLWNDVYSGAAGITLTPAQRAEFQRLDPSLGGPVIVPTPPGVPAPAPTSATTDVTGGVLPSPVQSIMQAGTVSPIPGVNAPTPTEQVAAAAQEASTGAAVEPQVAGLFTGIDLKDPKVLLTLAGLGVFMVVTLGQGGGGRRRRRGR